MRALGKPQKQRSRKVAQAAVPRTLGVRVFIKNTPTGFETTVSHPIGNKPQPLLTSNSHGLWRHIREWVLKHFETRGWQVDEIQADFGLSENFGACLGCKGSGVQLASRLEPHICQECHGIKVALPGFNDY